MSILDVTKIPEELKERRQWIAWRKEIRDGKTTKIPVNARTGRNASATDPNTWSGFETALHSYEQNKTLWAGIGFVFSEGDPYTGIDLDHCCLETGELEDWARKYVDYLNSYTELSQSATGIHTIVKGSLPPGGRHKGQIEMYDCSRFFVFTGKHLEGTPATIEERDDKLKKLHAKVFSTNGQSPNGSAEAKNNSDKQTSSSSETAGTPFSLTDTELIEKAKTAKNGFKFSQLWSGNITGYSSQSEADLALAEILAFWTQRDSVWIDRLFRQSGLFRNKWDKRHYGDGRTYGLGTIEKAIANTTETYNPGRGVSSSSHNSSQERAEVDWQDPLPLAASLLPVPKLDLELIPAPLRPWLQDIAERMQCPIDFLAVDSIVATATVIGNKFTIRPKEHDDWTVYLNLWSAIISGPGLLKTPAQNEVLKPLYRLVKTAQEEFQKRLSIWETQDPIRQTKLKALKEKFEQVTKKGESTTRIEEELIALKKEIADSPKPTEKRYVTSDTTIEKLALLLNENPNGLLLSFDELTSFLRSLDKVGHECARSFYLTAWNGGLPHTVDRVGRGTTHVEKVTLSIVGTIQPGPLAAYLRAALLNSEGADGFIQRFQLMVYPDQLSEFRNIDNYPNVSAKNTAFEVFKKLDELTADAIGASKDDEGTAYLRFAPDAQEFFNNWRIDLETELRTSEEHPALIAHLAKYRKLMPALALIFHLIEYVNDSSCGNQISLQAAWQAAAWCDLLFHHAKRVYGIVTTAREGGANTLATRLLRGEVLGPFRARDIYRNHWSGLSSSKETYVALALLEDLHWIRGVSYRPAGNNSPATIRMLLDAKVELPAHGKPQTFYFVNPKIKAELLK